MYVNQKHLNRNYTMLKVFKGKREGEEGGRLYEPLSYFGMNMCNVWISLNMIYAYHSICNHTTQLIIKIDHVVGLTNLV